MLTATLLGCGGTRPPPDRALASRALTVAGHSLLIDCGEGTQTAARRWGVSLYKVDAILLTHYHGDHIFGLPGLWQSRAALGRTEPVLMAGPPGLTALRRRIHVGRIAPVARNSHRAGYQRTAHGHQRAQCHGHYAAAQRPARQHAQVRAQSHDRQRQQLSLIHICPRAQAPRPCAA